jgi:hypothetical protein
VRSLLVLKGKKVRFTGAGISLAVGRGVAAVECSGVPGDL